VALELGLGLELVPVLELVLALEPELEPGLGLVWHKHPVVSPRLTPMIAR